MWDRLRKQIQLRVFCTEELFYSANCGICSCTAPCNENNINDDDDDDDDDEDDNDNQDNDENNDNDHNSGTTNIISLQEKNTKIREVIAR